MSMKFKNALVYQIGDNHALMCGDLAAKAAGAMWRAPGPHGVLTIGFTPLVDEDEGIREPVMHAAGATVFAVKRAEKKIPAAALRDLVKEKVRSIETEQKRRVYGRELRQLKEDITFDLLPKMPAVSAVTYGLIDHETGHVIIDATTSRAEECLSLIRNAIGSLAARTASVETSPSRTMTHWLTERRLPAPFALGDRAVLRMPGESDTAKLTGCDDWCIDLIPF